MPLAGLAPSPWRRVVPGHPWEWAPLPASHVTPRLHTEPDTPPPPAWPADPAALQVERVRRPDGRELGYWVWNASAFVRLPTESHQWAPRWEWAPAGTPLLLTPER